MNKIRHSFLTARQFCSILICAVFLAASAQAQSPISEIANDSLGNRSEFRFDLFRSLARRQSMRLRPAGFSLMPGASAVTNANAVSPLAAGPNLQVLGSGTIGRLTKWTGVTSSNSIIGDTTIFESKTGLVGIGTDSPASRLTVVGMIETTLGGYKFPDGTIQTTAGLASVFHDTTLQGTGTAASPLGVAVPLFLVGATGLSSSILSVENNGDGGGGEFLGGDNNSRGGNGVLAVGGRSGSGIGGLGVLAFGGGSSSSSGGDGVNAIGGRSGSSFGGVGAIAEGGRSESGLGGIGVAGLGGSSGANGGDGAVVVGGEGNGAGNRGGRGIFASKGIGSNGATDGLAGSFIGDVLITGNLNVTGTKNFKIDHPLDPENKYLVHAAIESSEVLNVYSGNVQTNAQGEATVTLPEWFEALNKDARYQLTVVGTFAQAIVAEKVKQNRFTIRTNAPNVEVSWQVTGVRADAVMRQRPFKAEEEKPERERGHYLNPEAYGQPEERSVEWTRHPEMMQRMKESRSKQLEKMRQKAQGNDR
jgi:hypothetical protein